MKKLFTTILMMGVAMVSWASVTAEYDAGTKTLTINYVADPNNPNELQNLNISNPPGELIKENMRNAETLVLTGDWENKDLPKIGTMVDRLIKTSDKRVFLDLSECTKMVSSVKYTGEGDTDWTSNNFVCMPNPNYPEEVTVTGEAFESAVYYNDWAIDPNTGQPQSWASPYTGEVKEVDDGNGNKTYTTPDGNPLVKFAAYVDENGNQVTGVTPNPDGTFSYTYTYTLDATPFSLDGSAFSNSAKYLNGISFPDHENFTAIPDQVFGETGPKDLASATVGNNVVWIGYRAFKNTKLTSFAFPKDLKVIGPEAFDNDDGEGYRDITLTSANLGNCLSLVKIGYEAFEGCAKMTSVTFPGGTNFTFLGNDAFKETGITSLEMKQCEGITEFQSNNNDGETFKTFQSCKALTYVSLPPNLTAVPDDGGKGVFNNCTSIKEVKFNGSGTYVDCELQNPCTIGLNAFRGAQQSTTGTVSLNNLTKVTLSNNISYIGENAFYAAAITEIHIPASVEELAIHCFYYCYNLTNVYFDAFDVEGCDCDGAETKIAGAPGQGGQGQGAFEECQNITDVYINTKAELQCDNNAFDQDVSWGAGDTEGNFATLHFPKDKTEHYVNLSHYLTDEIVTNPGKFHVWLEEHYDQALTPHKNGWYEFINSGPTEPNDTIEYQDIMLRTFSDWNYSYLVPNGLRAYVVNAINPDNNGNYEVTLQRITVIPKKTGVILYGHPNGKRADGSLTLVLTPVKFLENGDPLYQQDENGKYVYDADGQLIQIGTYDGPDQGSALCRANWGLLDENHQMYKNYLEPIISKDGAPVAIKPYELAEGTKKVTFRNFALGRYSSTDYFTKEGGGLDKDENNYVGFFRMKPQSYKSGYAYLRLTGDVDENGDALEKPEFNAADGGEILVKPDTPEADAAHNVLPYNWEVKVSTGVAFNAEAAVGTDDNPKGWWNRSKGFYWAEYSKSWGDRTKQFGHAPLAKYYGEFEDETDGIVKLVVPATVNTNEEYYTLQGVKVTNPTKGVYIHNGKKVIIK